MSRTIRSKAAGVSVEQFIAQTRFHLETDGIINDRLRRQLPDGISVRQVADLERVPQARTNFSKHAGSTTTVATIRIDHRAGRSCR